MYTSIYASSLFLHDKLWHYLRDLNLRGQKTHRRHRSKRSTSLKISTRFKETLQRLSANYWIMKFGKLLIYENLANDKFPDENNEFLPLEKRKDWLFWITVATVTPNKIYFRFLKYHYCYFLYPMYFYNLYHFFSFVPTDSIYAIFIRT